MNPCIADEVARLRQIGAELVAVQHQYALADEHRRLVEVRAMADLRLRDDRRDRDHNLPSSQVVHRGFCAWSDDEKARSSTSTCMVFDGDPPPPPPIRPIERGAIACHVDASQAADSPYWLLLG